jgi:hypothetical protein
MKILFRYSFLSLLLFTVSGCFSLKYDLKGGATINPKIKNLSVQFFSNRTGLNPNLGTHFTEGLKDYMEKNTSLRLVNTMGDVDFSGEINKYDIVSMGIVAGDVAAKTRFTIGIRVKFTDYIDTKNSFDTGFSGYRDFDSKQMFSTVEEDLANQIINDIIEQIFNKAFVNW